MDAKPIRGFRVHGDENAVPKVMVNKTLHSRNKSSPALSTMAAIGAVKLAARRTAFGDVSNTAHGNRPTKDDFILQHKVEPGYDDKEHGVYRQKGDTKVTASLLRPAQRPLCVAAASKNVSDHAITSTLRSQPISEPNILPTQVVNAHRSLGNKSAVGLKDSSALLQPLLDAVDLSRPLPLDRDLSIHQNQALEAVTKSTARPQLRKAQSSYTFKPLQADPVRSSSNYVAASNDAAVVDSIRSDPRLVEHEKQGYPFNAEADLRPALPSCEVVSIQPAEAAEIYQPQELDASTETIVLPLDDGACKNTLPAVPDHEEYWDEEEEEENYEEEGYVTARSFRSRGENITGNATTTLIPKLSQKARKEIDAARELVESMKTEEDLEDEAWDTSMVAEYGEEIFDYMRSLEVKMQPNPHYMDNQTEIQWSMRSVLMDWLVQVHHRFQLLPETLFLCVNYIDRFLTCKIVSLGKLQLVGATAIFVAAKYEEINCPSVSEIVYMVDSGYTVDEILKAERFMLSMLQFELGYPGPMSFLRRISKADDYDLETRTLAKYFLEITIMDERFLGCPPSFTAAGAHCLARSMLKKGNWSPAHVFYSNYTYAQLFPLVQLMFECCEDPEKHHAAIYDKYQDKRYKCASRFVHNEIRKGFQVPDVPTNNAQTFMNFYDTASWGSERQAYL